MKGLLLLLVLSGPALAQTVPGGATPARPPSRLTHAVRADPRRWRGTIGPGPVTLLLDSGATGHSGEYLYDHHGRALQLYQPPQSRDGALVSLQESDYHTGLPTGTLALRGPLGHQLTGTWRSADHKRTAPIRLLETYAGAARYEEEDWRLTRFSWHEWDAAYHLDSVQHHQSYLRVRLPERPDAEQRLRRALGPPVPTQRMAQYLDSVVARHDDAETNYYFDGNQYVVYNGSELLSVDQSRRFWDDSLSTTREWSDSRTFDLSTGRQLHLAELLVPGFEARLHLLLLRRLEQLWADRPAYDGVGANGRLPRGGFLASATGLVFTYDDRDAEELAFPAPYHADQTIEVELPYSALLPLIRARGPLDALLRERGLRPKK